MAVTTSLSLLLSPVPQEFHFTLLIFSLLVVGTALWETTNLGRLRLWTAAAFLLALVLLGAPFHYNVVANGARSLFYFPRFYGNLVLWSLSLAVMVTLDRIDVQGVPTR